MDHQISINKCKLFSEPVGKLKCMSSEHSSCISNWWNKYMTRNHKMRSKIKGCPPYWLFFFFLCTTSAKVRTRRVLPLGAFPKISFSWPGKRKQASLFGDGPTTRAHLHINLTYAACFRECTLYKIKWKSHHTKWSVIVVVGLYHSCSVIVVSLRSYIGDGEKFS